jgi:hypothetical protein
VALGQVFSEYFGFPYQFSFHRVLHINHLSSVAGKIGQLLAYVPSGLSLTPPQEIKKKIGWLSPSRFCDDNIRRCLDSNYDPQKNSIFLDITSCSPLVMNWNFGGTCRLHLRKFSTDYTALYHRDRTLHNHRSENLKSYIRFNSRQLRSLVTILTELFRLQYAYTRTELYSIVIAWGYMMWFDPCTSIVRNRKRATSMVVPFSRKIILFW